MVLEAAIDSGEVGGWDGCPRTVLRARWIGPVSCSVVPVYGEGGDYNIFSALLKLDNQINRQRTYTLALCFPTFFFVCCLGSLIWGFWGIFDWGWNGFCLWVCLCLFY